MMGLGRFFVRKRAGIDAGGPLAVTVIGGLSPGDDDYEQAKGQIFRMYEGRIVIKGCLPDWRHYDENRQRARDEYAAQKAAGTHAPDASNEYQAAKDGDAPPASLADSLTPAQTLTIHQLMDPEFKPVAPTGD
jgi:hypothetical protein